MSSEEKNTPVEALAELARLADGVEQQADVSALKAAFYRVEAIARQHAEDANVQRAAAAVKDRVIARARNVQKASGEHPIPTPPEMRATAAPPPPPPVQPVVPLSVVPPAATPEPAAPSPLRWKQALAAGVAIAVIVFAGVLGLERMIKSRRGAVTSTSAGTTTAPTPPPAEPQLPKIHLLTDLQSGTVALDGQPVGELQDGSLAIERVPAGKHSLKVSGKGGEASMTLDVTPGAAPRVEGPVVARNLLAVLVASSTTGARASSSVPTKLAVDGEPAGEIGPNGLELKSLAAGDHQLTLGEGKDVRKVVLQAGPIPALTAFLKLELTTGTLLLVTGEDDVKVFLSGKEFGRRTAGKQLRIPFLPAGAYVVRVSRDGYDAPPPQKAQVRKGEETRLEFVLRLIPVFAALRIQGAIPGTVVLVDQQGVGTVGEDRSFSASNIKPGEHSVELRRERHAPRRFEKQFRAGETVTIAATETAMETLPGTLRLNVSPPESRVTIRRANEPQARVVRERTLTLPEGSYVVTGSAQGHIERSVTAQVSGGETATVDLRLPAREQQAPRVQVLGMADWEDPKAWVQDGSYLVRKGGNYVLFRASPVSGSFTFTVASLKGKRLQWVLNYVDAKNYALFQLDRKNFYRKDVVNGKTFDLNKVSHNLGDDEPYTLQIDVASGSVMQRARSGAKWTIIDNWTQPARNFTYGKFGFLIQGNDRVGLANFSFTPR